MSLFNPVILAEKFYAIDYSKTSGFVINTWYEIVHIQGGGSLKTLWFYQTNTATNPIELDVRITIDGEIATYDASVSAETNNAKQTWAYMTDNALHGLAAEILEDSPSAGFRAIVGAVSLNQELKGHDILVEIQITDAIEAGQELYAEGVYSKIEAV